MFKETFKYYKSKNPPPILDQVLDFNNLANDDKVARINIDSSSKPIYGLTPLETWEAFKIINHPGLIFIKNPFTKAGQRYWIMRCLRDYSRKPNKSNLDPFNLVRANENWWEAAQGDKTLMDKLRWMTLGYHHNWDTKVYSEDSKSEFPEDLASLSKLIVEVLGFYNFRAEAAIVNYYHMDSTLSGHTDYSEQNLEAPLISFSLGQKAIFLLGGRTKEETPSAMFLRSGDVLVMSKESRLCYHGVPKILRADSSLWNDFKEEGQDENIKHLEEDLWKPFKNYLKYSRINVNVRQVLKRGQKRLYSNSEEKT